MAQLAANLSPLLKFVVGLPGPAGLNWRGVRVGDFSTAAAGRRLRRTGRPARWESRFVEFEAIDSRPLSPEYGELRTRWPVLNVDRSVLHPTPVENMLHLARDESDQALRLASSPTPRERKRGFHQPRRL